jgi:transposase
MWARIEPSLSRLKWTMGGPIRSRGTLIEGSIDRRRTGCAWSDLTAGFGPWRTVWKRRARFCVDGTWEAVLIALQAEAKGEIDWNVSAGSTIARVHQPVATAAGSEVTVTHRTGGSVE